MAIAGLPGGDFSGCVREMTGKVNNPEAFCAWKVHELTGKWPAEESISEAQSQRMVERVQLTDIEPGKGPYPGAIWNVTLIGPDPKRKNSLVTIRGREYVYSQNGIPYAVEALRDNVAMFEGCKVYDNHLTDAEFEARGGMRSFGEELTGVIIGVRFDESARRLRGQYRVGDRQYAQKLADFYELDILAESAGLSIDTFPVFVDVRHEGKRLQAAVGFERVNSTDVVTEPAAGGSLDRRIAARQTQEVEQMEITKEMVMEWIAEALAAALGTQEQVETPEDISVAEEEITAEEATDAVIEEVEAVAEEVPADADPIEAAQAVADAAQDVADMVTEVVEEEEAVAEEELEEAPPVAEALDARMRKLEAQLRLTESDKLLGAMLDAAKLGPIRPTVEAAFRGRPFGKETLMTVIKRAKEAQTARDTSGQVRGSGGTHWLNTRGSMAPIDQKTIGLMQLLAPRIPVIGSLRQVESIDVDYVLARRPEAMRAWINGGRDNYRPRAGKLANWLWDVCGYNPLNMRAREANDVSSITKDTVNLFLAAAYSVKNEWWADITSPITVETIDDVTLVRDYGLSDLAIVAAGGAYVDQELSDDEETGAHVKHGNTVSVTLEDMLKDKLDVLARIPTKLANAWFNTKSAKAAAVFTTNSGAGPVLSDGGALFNNTVLTTVGGHANLLTAVLNFTSYGASDVAMMKQTDKKLGVGNRLLAATKYLLVPIDLKTTGLQIRNTEYLPGSANNDVNPFYQQFDVIPVPNWTDATDFAQVADPVEHPAIYDVKVRGYEVPQVFTAGDESSGAVFTNDTWRWKVRLMTYRFSSTYDCMPVADFRPLHRSICAG